MATQVAHLLQLSQAVLAQLPNSVTAVLRHPHTQKVAALLLALSTLKTFNRSLSKWSLNNWTRSQPWQPQNELVLITGGSNGIGKQVVEDLARTGVRVIILDISEPTFQLPDNVFFYRADVTSTKDISEVAEVIRSNHGEPTVLINNAGVGYDKPILQHSEELIRRTFEINAMAHFWMVREFLPAMVKLNHGHVITMSSMASFLGLNTMADYCCTKASALAFHETLNLELCLSYNAPQVRTSIIHPSWVRTSMINSIVDSEAVFGKPFLTVETVSDAICKHIIAGNSGQIILPANNSFLSMLRATPSWVQGTLRSLVSRQLLAAQKAAQKA